MEQAPELIAIGHDDYQAKYIGKTADGRQFFLTTPFVPALATGGREFVALYLFDEQGTLLEADIEDLGTRANTALPGNIDPEISRDALTRKVEALGKVKYCRIEVRPFQVERFGVTFGLIPQPPEEEDEQWWVTAEPGDYMAFYAPWDSGDYDT